MTDRAGISAPIADSWDTYWRGMRASSVASQGGTKHPVVADFWDGVFGEIKRVYAAPRLVDVGSGGGAVVEHLARTYGADAPDLICLDIAPGAIQALTSAWPAVHGIVADAGRIPLVSSSVDVATSQFGVEYAGDDAFGEIARIVAKDGRLALLVHHRSGKIYAECTANLDAVRRIQSAEFVPRSSRMFAAGFAACRGADRGAYEAAARDLVPAIRALETIMQRYGRDAAGGTVHRLYRDVDLIHRRIQHHDPDEVSNWLRRMEDELEAYARRMATMRDAALDGPRFQSLCAGLRERSFELERAGALVVPGQALPLAWALIARGR
jgi:SAM-dependent methyltransferase